MLGLGTGFADCYDGNPDAAEDQDHRLGCEPGGRYNPAPAFYSQALRQTGVRLVDTAARYGTERGLGDGIRASGVARSDLFVVTKAMSQDITARVPWKHDVASQLRLLGLGYVDAYMSHDQQDAVAGSETGALLEGARREGKSRALGSSGTWQRGAEIVQAALSPCAVELERLDAWLAQGTAVMTTNLLFACMHDPIVIAVARHKHRTPQQTLVRWALQLGLPVLIGSTSVGHLRSNFNVFDFELDRYDMAVLESVRWLHYSDPTPAGSLAAPATVDMLHVHEFTAAAASGEEGLTMARAEDEAEAGAGAEAEWDPDELDDYEL
eukprot:g3062.t1